MPQLLDIPPELLLALPLYLRNIEDFVNTASTCRTLRTIFADTRPNIILRLAAASAPTFFSPHPHVLVLATARQVSDWATGDLERTAKLRTAFQGGMDSLLEFAITLAGLTLDDIRKLYNIRLDVMNVFADKIDKMAGKQWLATPNFWNGGVSEPLTVDADSSAAAYQIAVYGELFGSTMRACLHPAGQGESAAPGGFDRATRMEFIRYCIPEWAIDPLEWPTEDSPLTALPVGPYAPGHEMLPRGQWDLHYIVKCGRWGRMWAKVTRPIGPKLEEAWREDLWKNAVEFMGLESLKLVTVEADSEGKVGGAALQRLLGLRVLVGALPSKPEDAPDLGKELHACYGGRWRYEF